VADQELSSGDTRGVVFLRLSPGAVAFRSDRSVIRARVSRQLRDAIEDSDGRQEQEQQRQQSK